MASYIDNIFINARTQDVQAYTPDWNFLNQGQQILSATQKRNFADFAQRYNSIIDGDLTRQDNIKLRDTYKVQANEFVKQVSGADLTDPRNVKAAGAVFTPLVDNKMYIRDIVNTRAVKNAYAKTQSYATSLNPAERDLYNEDSLKQLNYFLQDFKNASPEEALRMQAPAYTPGINLEKMALNFFNRQQYDVEVEQNTGQWLIKTKGGKLVEGNLATGLMAEFYGDPLVRQNIVLENQMQKRDFVESNLMNYNGNKTAAEAAFYEQKYSGRLNFLETEGKKVIDDINGEVEVVDAVIKQLAKGENSDNTPMSDEPLTARELLMQNAERLKKLQQGIKQETAQAIAASTTKSKASAPYTINIEGKSYTPEQLDAIAFQSKVGAIANRLAMSRFSQTVKDNPYAMALYKSNLDARNKEAELLLKDRLDRASTELLTSNIIDIPQKPQVEIPEDEKEKIFTNKEEELNATASNAKAAENDLISYYINNFGGTDLSIRGKSLSDLTSVERFTIIAKATGIKNTGAANSEKHAQLSTKLKEYDNLNIVYAGQSKQYRDLLRLGVGGIEADNDVKTTMYKILEGGTDNIEKFKEEYIPLRASQIVEIRKRENRMPLTGNNIVDATATIFNALTGNLGISANTRLLKDFLRDSPEEDAAEEFDQLVTGNAGFLTKTPSGWNSGSDNSIANQVYRNAKEKDQFGNLIGLGGIIPYSKNLGRSTNISNSMADIVLSNLVPRLSGSNVTYSTGEFSNNLNSENSENYKPVSDQMANVIQVMTDAVLQKQKETTSTLRGMGVKVYQRSPKDDLYLHIIPDENTAKLVTETSDKGKTSLTDVSIINSMLSSGLTLKIPGKNVPPGLISFEKLSSTQQRFLVEGKITIGSSNVSADKGELIITYNAGQDNFEVLGRRIENGKFVPVGDEIQTYLNQQLRVAQQRRNQGEVVEPYSEVIKIAEKIYDGF